MRKFVYIDKLPSGAYSVRHWGPCPCTDHAKAPKEPFFYREWRPDYQAAQKREADLLTRLLAVKQNIPDPTLNPVTLLEEYVNDPSMNKGKGFSDKTKENKRSLIPYLQSISSVSSLKAASIDRWLVTFPNPTTRSFRYRDLHAFCVWMVKEGYITINPFEFEKNGKKKKLIKPQANERDVKLSLEEIKQLLDNCSTSLRLRLLHLVFTGRRKSEILGTRWEHLDLKNATWFIPKETTKSKRDSSLPLDQVLVEEFKQFQQKTGFTSGLVHPKNNLNRQLTKLKEDLKIATEVTPHVFRHSFASHWRGSPTVLMGLLGWKSMKMIEKYTHLGAEDLRSEAQQFSVARTIAS